MIVTFVVAHKQDSHTRAFVIDFLRMKRTIAFDCNRSFVSMISLFERILSIAHINNFLQSIDFEIVFSASSRHRVIMSFSVSLNNIMKFLNRDIIILEEKT